MHTAKQLYQPCSTCHGESGNTPILNFPKLAGQNPHYLDKQLQDYQTSQRVDPIMSPIAQHLSPEDIDNLLAYLAQFKSVSGVTDPTQLTLGEKLYRSGLVAEGIPACAACHGPAGLGNNQAEVPALAGQNSNYTVAQLNAFQHHTRHNDANQTMQSIAQKLSEQDKKAVASFISGLH